MRPILGVQWQMSGGVASFLSLGNRGGYIHVIFPLLPVSPMYIFLHKVHVMQ